MSRCIKLGCNAQFFIKSFFLGLIIIFLCSCSTYHKVELSNQGISTFEKQNDFEDLISSVEKVVNAGGNHYRKKAIIKRLDAFGLKEHTHQERIDWLSVQKNIIVDLPGKSDSLVYVVAHYDKTDINPLKYASILLNGLLDPLISWSYTSQGAIDNATGVAVAIQVMKLLQKTDRHYSYRMLLAGSEESGIRGSRAHVARLSLEEFDKIKYVINIDVVGVKEKQNCVYTISDDGLENSVKNIAKKNSIKLGVGSMPVGASSDYLPFKKTSFGLDFARSFAFNLTGSLLPQRSYFTAKKATKIINFSACKLIDAGDYIAGTILLPVGSLHGFRDNIKKVDPVKLHQMYDVIRLFIEEEEKRAIF